MKPLNAWPRQPFFGVAISAMAGILVADNWPHSSLTLAIVLVVIAIAAWFSRRSLATYALVGLGFFVLHSFRTKDSPGQNLARALGDEPRPITVRGTVITEPKISERGYASFLLKAEAIEIDGESHLCRAKLFTRWRH